MHTQVDIACAALFLVATRMLVEAPTRGRFLVVACALGLYLGTKFTGALHLVALLPWVVPWARSLGWWAVVRGPVLAAGLGGARYLANVLAHGSPFWPFQMRVPVLGLTLPGALDPGPINLAASGSSGAFFTAPYSIPYIGWAWYHDDAALWPDVRSGGFGLAFRWLLVPCLALLFLDVLRRRSNTRLALPVLAVFVLALVVPMPWWPRYTLAAGGMGLVALAAVLAHDARAWARWIVGVGFVGLLLVSWVTMISNLLTFTEEYRWPAQVAAMREATPEVRERQQVTTWLWPSEYVEARDARFADGGVLLFDESADFPSELFAKGLRNTPRYQTSSDTRRFMATLDETNACWVLVTAGSPLEETFANQGMELLFAPPRTNSHVWDTRRCR
jgi:hypothetical protein